MSLYKQQEMLEALQDAIESNRWSSVVFISDVLMKLYEKHNLSQSE